MSSRASKNIITLAVALALLLPLPVYLFSREADDIPASPDSSSGTIQSNVSASEGEVSGVQTASPQPSSLPETQQTDTLFWIEIPSIQLKHDIEENVDPADEDVYLDVIERNVAHGKYTAFPSASNGNTYLFAHSKERYDGTTPDGGWFTRIDELENGDVIFIYFHGKMYTYTVTGREIVDPLDTSVYRGSSLYPNNRSLTLQTCYPRGDTGLRLMVYAIGE